MPLEVVCQHAQQHVRPNALSAAMVDRSHFEIDGLDTSESAFDGCEIFVGPYDSCGIDDCGLDVGAQDIDAVEESLGPIVAILAVGFGIRLLFFSNPAAEQSDHWKRTLRARRERPGCRRAGEKRDEIAPFHCPVPPVLPNERNSTPRYCCAAGFQVAYDRCRSKSAESV